MKLLSLGTDKKIFTSGSDVSLRQIEYGKKWEEIHIIVSADSSYSEKHVGGNVWAYPTKSKIKPFYSLEMIRLGKFIISRKDITNITTQDPFLTAMAGVSLKKQFGIPLEIQVHTDISTPRFSYNLSNRIRRAMALSYLPQADNIRVVSNRMKEFLINDLKIPLTKIEVRPIPVDVENVKNAPIAASLREKYPQFNKIVLMASRLEKEKNIELAIKAFGIISKQEPRTGLIIVGEGSEKIKLQSMVSDMGLEKSIVFEPWVEKEVLYSYYKTCNIFLLTSLYEGYGLTLAEAQAAGTKIISTDVGIAREVGAKITPYDPKILAEAIVIS